MLARTKYLALYCLLTCFVCKMVHSVQRCQKAPNWLVDGTNPILETAKDGNVVVLSLVTSKSKQFLLHTLDALNNYGRHYSYVVQQNVQILVINGQGDKLPEMLIDQFQYIKIYDEPDNDVFKKLRGNAWDVIVYDICGRMQFRYVYPYSWLGFPFLSRAINYAVGKYQHVCGSCVPLSHYKQLPAKIPPTMSSSHIPAEVVTVTSGEEGKNENSVVKVTPGEESKNENSVVKVTSGEEGKSENREMHKVLVRAHRNPILRDEMKHKEDGRRKTNNNNDVKKYIILQLDKFLNKRGSKMPTTPAVLHNTNSSLNDDQDSELNTPEKYATPKSSTIPVTQPRNALGMTSRNQNESNTSLRYLLQVTPRSLPETTNQDLPGTSTQDISETSTLPVTDAITQKKNTPKITTPTTVPTLTKEDELDREIKEENEKLYKQIETAEERLNSKTESVGQNNEEESDGAWNEDKLLFDYFLQRMISNKK